MTVKAEDNRTNVLYTGIVCRKKRSAVRLTSPPAERGRKTGERVLSLCVACGLRAEVDAES
jgi:hypothetical protein